MTQRELQNIIILKNRLDSASTEASLCAVQTDSLNSLVAAQENRIKFRGIIIDQQEVIIEGKDKEITDRDVIIGKQKKTISTQGLVLKIGIPVSVVVGVLLRGFLNI